MKNTTPKTKTKTTKPVVDIVKMLAEIQDQLDNHAEVINANANANAEACQQDQDNANVLDAKVTLVFWFCGITTAIATALAITALVCK
jgi:hypothetical protein